jgi:Na+/H+ antiporter NhaD/arsenite permease-like protein
MFFVPVDKEYMGYFDYKTLVSLFCMLAVVAGLKNTNVFELISKKLIGLFHTRRAVIYSLIFGTFFFDMIVANDMSLITFLPLTYIVLHSTNNDKYLSITFILQTIAANMGGMITPYGNPQNLFLYSYYNIPTAEFFGVLLIQSVAIAVLLVIAGLFIKNEELVLKNDDEINVDKKKLTIYAILFVFVILSIFRIVPHLVTLAIVILTVLLVDRKRFSEVDYALLATFCVFFIFSGNIARISAIKDFIASIVTKNTLAAGIISCQFISNVPTAIFLSKFTENYRELLVSVNIGSLGIIISSLASLITLKEFLKHQPQNFKRYMGTFTLINTAFLLVMLVITILTN